MEHRKTERQLQEITQALKNVLERLREIYVEAADFIERVWKKWQEVERRKKNALLITTSILAWIVLSIYAYKQRGYYAIGGEHTVLLIPFLYYTAEDTYNTYR